MTRQELVGRGAAAKGSIAVALLLMVLAYCRYFAGTYFTQDDYVWLCFGKFYEYPLAVLWRDVLSTFFRPVGLLWWWVMHAIGGERVIVYQIGFLAVHLMNSVLAGVLAGRICGRRMSVPVALLFGLNPLFISSISAHYFLIFDTLGFGFYLLSLLLVASGLRKWAFWKVALSGLFALASYFSKEAFFTLPAMIVVVLGIREPDCKWEWPTFRQHVAIWLAHVVLWGLAFTYRSIVIGHFGGYGLASVSSWRELVTHVIERLTTWCDLCLSSIVPFFADWLPIGLVTTVACLVVLVALTWLGFHAKLSSGPICLWAWLLLTWTPSLLMVTYSPVTFYPCSFASTLLVVLALSRAKSFRVVVLALGLYYAVFAFQFYHGREPKVATLRSQYWALRNLYPNGGTEANPGDRLILFGSAPDLYPDPIVKYGTSVGHRMPDVLFFNDKAPIAWVVTNPDALGSIAPIYLSNDYQRGYTDIDPYWVYPLSFAGRQLEILRAGPPFRFLKWEGKQLVDITSDNPEYKKEEE